MSINKKEGLCYNILRNLYYGLKQVFFYFGYLTRKAGISQYKMLRQLKDSYRGERCFIIATGPSLRIEDLDKLKKEYTFSCNSIIAAYEKTDFRPTFYGIQDMRVYKSLENRILSSDYKYVFTGSNLKIKKEGNVVSYPLDLMMHPAKINPKHYRFSFSKDCSLKVCDGFSVTYSLLQLAIYMGFQEIYLLGADCSYSSIGSKQHFIDTGIHNHLHEITGKLMINAYKKANEYISCHEIKVYNATRGGELSVFPRVSFDDLELKQ